MPLWESSDTNQRAHSRVAVMDSRVECTKRRERSHLIGSPLVRQKVTEHACRRCLSARGIGELMTSAIFLCTSRSPSQLPYAGQQAVFGPPPSNHTFFGEILRPMAQ